MSAAPTKYVRYYDFTTYQATNPDTPLPAPAVDQELNRLKTSTDQTIDRLAEIQRSDGALANIVVTPDSLSSATKALMVGTGVPRGTWVTATAYAVKDIVTQGITVYICITAHTSGVFATDLAAGKWMVFAQQSFNQSLNTTDHPIFSALDVVGGLAIGGATVFSLGTAPLPSATFTGDLDTGFYSHSANNLGVACGGALVGRFNSAGLVLGSTTYVKGDTVPMGTTNNQLGALGLYTKCLIFLAWNGGSGFALVAIQATGAVNIIASSNAAGGDNCFDNVNGAGSNGGNGIAIFNSGGFVFVQLKTTYAGGTITVHRFGG